MGQQKIMLNNLNTILHTSDKQMKQEHISNDESYLSDEC